VKIAQDLVSVHGLRNPARILDDSIRESLSLSKTSNEVVHTVSGVKERRMNRS
jgi:hypothetical protein